MHTVIAIVSYKNADDVVGCINSLGRITDQDFSVVVCENGGREAFECLTAALSSMVSGGDCGKDPVRNHWGGRLVFGGQSILVVCAHENLGYGGGVNTCIRSIPITRQWGAVWVLNPDTEVHPGALKALKEKSCGGGYGIIGSRLVFKGTNKIQLYGGRWRPLIARGYNIGLNEPADVIPDVSNIEKNMTYVNGASMYVVHEFVDAIGLMDERYFLYCEEVDWCYKRGRYKLGYAHESIIFHAHGSTIGSNIDRRKRSRLSVYLDERNKLLFTKRFYPKLYPIVIVTTFFLIAQYLKARAFSNYLVALSGWIAGIKGETGERK